MSDVIQLTEDQLQEIAIYEDPVTFIKVFTGLEPRDYQARIMRDRSRRIILRMGRQVGKCVRASARIIDAGTGSLVSVEDLYNMDPDERGPILTLDDSYQIRATDLYSIEYNGVKGVYRVTTRLGRSVELTSNHPLLTAKGWAPLENLSVGDRIAVPRRIPVFGSSRIPDSEVKVLAYVIADGCVTRNSVLFSNENSLIVDDFMQACRDIGGVDIVKEDKWNYRVKAIDVGRSNPVKDLLKRHKVVGKGSHEKAVPDIVFTLDKSQVALFLNRLFACDGWACVSKDGVPPHGSPQIGYRTASKKLPREVQHLLLRFGILSNLVEKKVPYKGKTISVWQLLIDRKESIEIFAREIGIFGKELDLEGVLAAVEQIEETGNHDTVPSDVWDHIENARVNRGPSKADIIRSYGDPRTERLQYHWDPARHKAAAIAEHLEDKELTKLSSPDIFWDEIASIEFIGYEDTYDLHVPETLNFVADDVFVHNTFTMSCVILWHAFTVAEAYVMVAAPYDNHVKKIFQELRRFIRKSDLLSASVVRDTQNPQTIQFGNGSTIAGFTAGTKSGNKGDSARGQSPTMIVLDEVDRMTDDDLDSILGARFANPMGVRILMASTPTGRRNKFYHWCVKAQGGKVQVPPGRYRNEGWTTYYYPSTINPSWQIRDPETGLTMEEELRASGELSEMGWVREVLAEFGEETVGVFRKQDIQASLRQYKYYSKNQSPPKTYKDGERIIRTIGVDWDKYGDVGTNIVVTEYDRDEKKFKIVYREEIPRSEWTFDNAVQRIIKLNDMYNPMWIYIDRGAGDYQYEALRKHGKDKPETGLLDKVVSVHFSEHREIRDPVSKAIEKKPAKPFMVNQTETLLSRGKIILNQNDNVLVRQFNNYSVVRITASGQPQYTSVDEHILDAFMLSILAFAEKMPELTQTLFNYRPATKIAGIALAAKQHLHAQVSYGAPEEVMNDPYELHDWKLKNNKLLVRAARGSRFQGSFQRRASPSRSIRRVW